MHVLFEQPFAVQNDEWVWDKRLAFSLRPQNSVKMS